MLAIQKYAYRGHDQKGDEVCLPVGVDNPKQLLNIAKDNGHHVLMPYRLVEDNKSFYCKLWSTANYPTPKILRTKKEQMSCGLWPRKELRKAIRNNQLPGRLGILSVSVDTELLLDQLFQLFPVLLFSRGLAEYPTPKTWLTNRINIINNQNLNSEEEDIESPNCDNQKTEPWSGIQIGLPELPVEEHWYKGFSRVMEFINGLGGGLILDPSKLDPFAALLIMTSLELQISQVLRDGAEQLNVYSKNNQCIFNCRREDVTWQYIHDCPANLSQHMIFMLSSAAGIRPNCPPPNSGEVTVGSEGRTFHIAAKTDMDNFGETIELKIGEITTSMK